MEMIVYFDDTGEKSEIIKDVIGNKGFSDIVVRKKKLGDYYHDSLNKIFPKAEWKYIHSIFEYYELSKKLEDRSDHTRVLHCFSNYLISDEERALLSFEKLPFVDEPYRVMCGKKVAAVMFPNISSYVTYCSSVCKHKTSKDAAKEISESFDIEGLIDISVIGNFIQCITGNFDSRYFNSLKGNEYTLVKSSSNKKKIKSEYTLYHLLPEDMKFWYVMPFNYQETEHSASYTMERLHMTDIAIKWIYGSIDESEFEELMRKYFFFFQSRHKKECTKEEYQKMSDTLYKDKVIDRINDLKKMDAYGQIQKMLEAGSSDTIDSLVDKYFYLKEKIESKNTYPSVSVIGHGDPCFANALYNKATKTLKFIDPKGALTEDELWMNPYYDIAKLSHSVCGRYDFFNNAMFDIKVGEDFSCNLEIAFDNSGYIDIFRKKLTENGYDYLTVRIYEASLFLSMLPLHIDNPHKVLGFILNVKNILKEIEKDV